MLYSMVLDRTKKGVIYLGGREGIHESEDGGNTWTTLSKGCADPECAVLAEPTR